MYDEIHFALVGRELKYYFKMPIMSVNTELLNKSTETNESGPSIVTVK